MQIGRNLTEPIDGFIAGAKYLILDRDSTYSPAFRNLLTNAGIEVIRLPPRSPNLNAYAERFVRRMIFFSERSLRKATREFTDHYHTERNHQGLDNRLIKPEHPAGHATGAVVGAQRLGGMLRFYHRAAAA